MVETLASWPRVRERAPFDPAEHNRLMNFLEGYIAAPFRLVQSSGSFALIWTPTADLFIFGASIRFNATLTLDNTIWLDGYKADHATSVHLIRVNTSDVIELGASSQRLSFLAALTNNTNIAGRNALDSASITLIKLNTSDVIELGEANQRITIAGALTNNTSLAGRNAANGANVTLVKLNTDDIVEVGETASRMILAGPLKNNTGLLGRDAANANSYALIKLTATDQVSVGEATLQTNLLGTVSAPVVDPPTIATQVTAASQCKAFGYASVAAGVVTLGQNYNVVSVVRNLAGDFTVTLDRDFTAATYAVMVTVQDNAAVLTARVNGQAAGSFDVHVRDAAGVLTDPDGLSFCCFGTLA